LPRGEIAGASWRDFGAVILVRELDEAVALVDAIAPEHLEIAAADADRLAGCIRNAGAIFIGAHTPEAIGDYVAGSNHVLPTARSARFSSGLGVLAFMKRTSILKCGPEQLHALADAAIALAEAEALTPTPARWQSGSTVDGARRRPGGEGPPRGGDPRRSSMGGRTATSNTSARSRSTISSRTTAFVRSTMTAGPTPSRSASAATASSSTSAKPTAPR
jgi:hypothetical protein